MKSFRLYLESQFIDKLNQAYAEDQHERQEYKSYLAKFKDWRQAAEMWAKDKSRSPNDLFNDKQRLNIVKNIITNHIEEIKLDKKLLKTSWLLVQHMDDDVNFQKWFLNQLNKRTQNYRYLYDRVAVNSNLPQKYNTQQ
jgi:hypothetical protein